MHSNRQKYCTLVAKIACTPQFPQQLLISLYYIYTSYLHIKCVKGAEGKLLNLYTKGNKNMSRLSRHISCLHICCAFQQVEAIFTYSAGNKNMFAEILLIKIFI